MSEYNIICRTNQSTVVTEYTPNHPRSDTYQSEAELEREYISLLSGQGYEFLPITNEAALITNLRQQLEVEVNIDYILMLVEQYHASNCEDKTILAAISKAINSSIELRSKKELIERFVEQVNVSTGHDIGWQSFVQMRKEEDLTALIADEKLKDEEARRFIDIAFRDGVLKTTGTDIDKIMPPVSRFGGGNRAEKKQGIIDKLTKFFEKYAGLV